MNASDEVVDDLIKQIAGGFSKNPRGFEFREIRAKMWEENKAEILAHFSEEVAERITKLEHEVKYVMLVNKYDQY